MAIGTVENLTGEISYSREHELTAYGDILAITSATIGITEELTGEQTLTDRYELTTYDDILKIRDAVINLASPAGDLFTSGGNDTVTIENSTIAAQAEGLAFFLGSGNDTLILNNSTLNAPILSGSGNDLVRVVGDSQSRVLLKKRSDTSTLSLGADDDVLELSAVLEGDGDIDFGTGNDTLRFDGGSLLTSGALSVFSRLEVSALGGYLGRDLNLAGELIAITLGGNLTGSDGSRIISISGSDISLNTANNVKTNIAFSISESVFDHKAGGTIEINGYMGYAFQADDATVIFHDLVLSENFCGLYGTNTQWVVERGRFSDNEQAASLTGGTLQLSDVDISSQTAGALNLDNTLFTGADLSFSSNRDTEKMMNQVLPFATSTATSYSSGTSLFHTAIVSAVVTAQGGAIYANTDVSLEQVRFHRNNTEAVISQADDNIARVSAKTTGGFWARATGSAFTSTFATAAGGAIYQAAGDISLSSAVFSGNYATAFASGTATATANVSAFGTGSGSALAIAICSADIAAYGGAICQNSGALNLTSTTLSQNYASAQANVKLVASPSAVSVGSAWFEGNKAEAEIDISAKGGAIYKNKDYFSLSFANLSENVAYVDAFAYATAYATAATAQVDGAAQGGAIYQNGGNASIDSVNFYGNSAVVYASGAGVRGVKSQQITWAAQGGAIYADSVMLSLIDTAFSNNNTEIVTEVVFDGENPELLAQGGAIYLTGNSRMDYTISAYSFCQNYGNIADEGGFLYIDSNAEASFFLEDMAELVIGSSETALTADSIAGSGEIQKNGSGIMTIHSDITDFTGIWNINAGSIVLASQVRTISLGNWNISSNAELELSTGDDTLYLDADKNIGILDMGGGADIIDTRGYRLFCENLQINHLTLTGGGIIAGTLVSKDLSSNLNIILDNIQLDCSINGGAGDDSLYITRESQLRGTISLGNGNNLISATAKTDFREMLTMGRGDDSLNFMDVIFDEKIDLGAGNNSLNVTGTAIFNNSLLGGAGNDQIHLKNTAEFNGLISLGGGKNLIECSSSVVIRNGFLLDGSGETTLRLYNGANLIGNTFSLYSSEGAELKSLSLDWSTIPELDKVRIVVSDDASFNSFEFAIELYNQSKNFTLNIEENYYFQFQAQDEDGWAQRYLDDTIAPDQVSGLTWSGNQARWGVTHDNWGGNGVKQYHVELSRDAGFNDVVESATVTTTEYTFTGTTEGNYYWRVRAEDFTGNLGDWSETANVFVDLTAPTAPRGLTSVPGDYSVTFSWSAASDSGSGVALYEYRIAPDSSFASITVSGESSSISDVTVNDLLYGTYYWQVRAIDNSGNIGEWSLYKTFSIADIIAPTAPGQLDYQLDGNTVTLDWLASSDDTDGSGLKEYRIEFSNQADFSQIIFSRTSTSTRITVDELSGGDYFCRVSAVDQSGNVSDWSNVQNFQIEESVQNQTLPASDINGNGVSDVLFQYTGGDHQLGFWLDGTDNWQGQGLSEPAEWDVIGAYDMSSDGKADVVMLGNVTVSGVKGAFVGYRKNGDMSTWENISYLTNSEGIDWQVDVGNLTGNAGKNSILWHAPDLGAVGVWTDGTDNWVSLGAGYDRNWEMLGAGDFDGDGADSILFSYADGAKYYTLDLDQTATELGVSDSGWEVQAIGDFSGDGKDDIVAFNAATGLVAKWEDGNSGSWSSLGQLNAADWFIAGAGDYNGDGTDDLLVRQYSTGMLGYYADADLSQWNEMGRGVDMNWAVIA